jgi:prevent-host-death family protein
MKTISTTEARKNLSYLIQEVQRTGTTIGIVRHGKVGAYLTPAPTWNENLSDITNMAALGGAFDFLHDEPDIYTEADLKVRYA